ncbi:MAG: DNA repair protein [Chloroflexi bacterium]|nr:DNA repair protein [Chloroflexota bacterium]
MSTTAPISLPFSGNDEADRLIAANPLALLVGFVLDQQVTVQKAFSGPLEIQRRTGTLDAATLANMDPEAFAEIFRQRPAIHRFPGSMAGKVQALCAAVAHEHGNDAASIWRDAHDARDLERRLLALPGIGPMKAKTILAVLGKRFGIKPAGWAEVAPEHPTLGDVDSAEALARYQAGKRAHKAALRAGGSARDAGIAAMEAGEG